MNNVSLLKIISWIWNIYISGNKLVELKRVGERKKIIFEDFLKV